MKYEKYSTDTLEELIHASNVVASEVNIFIIRVNTEYGIIGVHTVIKPTLNFSELYFSEVSSNLLNGL